MTQLGVSLQFLPRGSLFKSDFIFDFSINFSIELSEAKFSVRSEPG